MTNVKIAPNREPAPCAAVNVRTTRQDIDWHRQHPVTRPDSPAEQWYALRSTPLTPKGTAR